VFKNGQTEESIAAIDSKGALREYSPKHVFVPHTSVFRTIRRLSDELRGIGEVAIYTPPSGQDMIAACEVVDKTVPLKEGTRLWLGVINCNSRKRASRYFGLVTDHGMPVVLDKFAPWSHTQGLDLKNKTETAMDLFAVRSAEYPARCARLAGRTMESDEAEWLIYKAKITNIIGTQVMKQVRLTYKAMTKTRRKSAWTLCCAFGKALLESLPMINQPKRDLFSQSWAFVRLVNATRLVSVEGPL